MAVNRRTRNKKVSPNPLLEKWLEEWRDEAKENGSKISYSFNKALFSVKKYPLPINSGSEAKQLEYIGEKVAKMIDQKIKEFIDDGGSLDDLHSCDTTTHHKPQQPNSLIICDSERSQDMCSTFVDNGRKRRKKVDDSDSGLMLSPVPCKKCKISKEYVPSFRSGPYAIVIALYNARQNSSYKGYMLKHELIAAAQSYTDTSFTRPEEGSYYTAWSSMPTIIAKGFISKSSHPPKFTLTEKGVELADKLLQNLPSPKSTKASDTESDQPSPIKHSAKGFTKNVTNKCSRVSPLQLSPSPPMTAESVHQASLPLPSCSKTSIISCGNSGEDVMIIPLSQRLAQWKAGVCTIGESSNNDKRPTPASKSHGSIPRSLKCANSVSSQESSTVLTFSQESVSSYGTDELLPSIQAVDLSTPKFTLNPGQFEVILCIDNAELTANKRSKIHFRNLLLEELNKNGVAFHVRKLSVGDFVWIAREQAATQPGQLRLPGSREVVLEYIVERKTIEDLASSVIDKRFHEQKFRMKNSGIRHPIYLVEESGDIAHCGLSEDAIQQAIINTQVCDGFHIKETSDIKESIAYLTIMTRKLQKHYADKKISAHSIETVDAYHSKSPSLSRSLVIGMPFEEFDETSIKDKICTVSELFARTIIQMPQSSGDKAAAVVNVYPTIAHLRKAYRKCTTEKQREELVSCIKAGAHKRKLGVSFSKLLYSLYWKE